MFDRDAVRSKQGLGLLVLSLAVGRSPTLSGNDGGKAGGIGTAGGSATGGGSSNGGATAGGTTAGGSASGSNPCANAPSITPGVNAAQGNTADAGNSFRFLDTAGCQGSQSLPEGTAGDAVFAVAVPQVFEATSVIEYHYCAMGTATGDSASIGLENSMGNAGISVSFNSAGQAATGSGYRFTP